MLINTCSVFFTNYIFCIALITTTISSKSVMASLTIFGLYTFNCKCIHFIHFLIVSRLYELLLIKLVPPHSDSCRLYQSCWFCSMQFMLISLSILPHHLDLNLLILGCHVISIFMIKEITFTLLKSEKNDIMNNILNIYINGLRVLLSWEIIGIQMQSQHKTLSCKVVWLCWIWINLVSVPVKV